MLKVGDKVRNIKAHGPKRWGVVTVVKVPGMRDCALVRYTPDSDGYCIPREFLVRVDDPRNVDDD